MRPVQHRLLVQTVLLTLALGFVACTDADNPMRPTVRTLYTTPTGLLTANPPQVFTGAGDISSCSNTGDEATAKLLDAIPDGKVFNIGDDAYNNGTDAEFACYDATWGRHKTRTYPSAGNHEYNTSGATGYYKYFGAIAQGPDYSKGTNGQGYYSFSLGAWHIIVLNSNVTRSVGSLQDTWLANDLAAHPNQCTLAYWHHPLYSSTGGSGSGGVSIASMQPFWNRLYAAHADLVLNGHRHFYERLKPMKPDGSLDLANGITEIIAGSGGIGGGSETNLFPTHVTGDGSTFGVIKLYLYDDSFAWKFIPVAGKSYTDSGSTACHSSGGGGGGGGGGVSAQNSTVSAAPTSFTAGSGSSQITVTALDASNNPLSGSSVTLASTGSGNTFTPSSGTTNGSGQFISTFTSSVAEGKTISANIDGTAITQTAAVTVNSSGGGGGGGGTVTPTLLTSGGDGTNQKVYTTASVSPAANSLVTVAVLGRSGSGPFTPTIAGGGMSTWTLVTSVDFNTTTTPLSRLVVYRAMSSAPGSGPITITYSSSQSNAQWLVTQWTGVDQTGSNGSGAIGQTAASQGNSVTTLSVPLSGFANTNNVGFGIAAAAGTVTPGSGFTELGEGTSGESMVVEGEWGTNKNVIAASWASSNAGLLGLEIKAGAPSGPVVSAAQSQVQATSPITAGGAASTITVTAKDGSGNPISGATVVLAATGSNNTLTQPVGTTALDGTITGSLSSTTAENKTVSATINSVPITQQPTVTVQPGIAAALAFSVQPSTTAAGATITPAVQVQVRDAFNNLVTGAANSVTIAGPASLSGTLTQTASGGIATFGDLSVGTPGTGYTLTASATALAGATSNTFNISATPAKLGFVVQPSNAAAGATIAPAVQVEIQDAGGSRVTTATNQVTLSFGNNPGGANLSGTIVLNAVNGVATFNNLSINNPATGYTLAANAASLTGATSNSFDITPPVASAIQHSLLTAGSDVTNQKIYTTASIAPAANTLVTIAIIGHTSGTASLDPTVSGGGVSTWSLVASTTLDPQGSTAHKRLSLFRAVSTGSGSGAITISFPTTESNAAWVVSQWTGVDLTGTNGSNAIVQTKTFGADAASSIATTLAALGSANNVAYGVVGTNGSAVGITPGAGFTEISEQKPAESTNSIVEALWATNQTAPSASWSGSFNAAILAVEIKAGP